MQINHTAPTARQRDNLFGICHAIGQAFGIDPLILRVAMLLAMLVDFEVAAIAYMLAGAAVLAAALADRAAALRRSTRARA